ncbi:MAG: porin family protein [Deltaproteobacteria bacterium]|nr:porin family protein [Deltaproteobacteria bacterium]
MKRTLLVAALLIASTGVASAGLYGGLSVGPGAAVQDDMFDLESPGRAVRLLGGYRLGRLSAEASVFGNTLRDFASHDVEHRQVALLGKYNFPLGSNFELFGRAGLQHTWLTLHEGGGGHSFTGSGIILGPGVEYRLNFVAASASIRLDYTISYVGGAESDTYGGTDDLSFTSGQWMLGFTVGI